MALPVSFLNIPGNPAIPNSLPPTNQGSAFSDGVRVGSVRSPLYNYGLSGIAVTPFVTTYIPSFQSMNTSIGTLSAAVTYPGGTFAVLNPTSTPSAGNTVINGQFAKVLDVPRNIGIQALGGSPAISVKIWGYDQWFQPLTEQINISYSGNLAWGLKTFKYVTAIKVLGSTGGATMSFGGGLGIGTPYLNQVPSGSASMDTVLVYLNGVLQSIGTNIGQNISFVSSGTPAMSSYIVIPAYTAGPQTLTTADVRSSIWFGQAFSGELVIHQAVLGAGNYDIANPTIDGYPSQSFEALYGRAQYSEAIA